MVMSAFLMVSLVADAFNLRWVDSPWLATKINLCGSAFRRKNSVMPRLLAAGIGILALRIFTYWFWE